MPEIPLGYWPDVKVKYSPTLVTQFSTEIEVDPYSGEEQRRGRSVASGQRIWRAESVPQDQKVRRVIAEKLTALRGQLNSCYFFAPDSQRVVDASLGVVAAASSIVIPWKEAAIAEIRVDGSPKAFTARGLAPREGRYAALRFDGANDYVMAGSAAALKIAGDLTYAAWIFVGAGAGQRVVVSNFVFNGAASSGTALRVNAGGTLQFYTGHAAGFSSATTAAAVPVGIWTHVAVVKSGTNVSFFFSGAHVQTSGAITQQAVAAGDFVIGQDGAGALYWNGMLADVRVYAAALTPGEIASIYADTAPPNAALRAHWPIDEGYGASVEDCSGGDNTATLVSSPLWIAGEMEVTFTAGPQTGTVTGSLTGRPRVIARSLRDGAAQSFVPDAADILTSFPIEMLELPAG
jgi:hypothetical protein